LDGRAASGGLTVFYVAKGLQAIGMVNLMVGLYAGLTMERGMTMEYALLGAGTALFLLGRYLEPRG
jgi:hypothetical protein